MDRTVWRWFPVWLIAAMGVVFAVNGYMIYDALSTFPGQAGQDGFDLSNEYQRVLATAQQQAALGWHIEVSGAPIPELHLTDRNGMPLTPTSIDAQVERPVGPTDRMVLNFRPVGDGTFQADSPLPGGQWEMMLTVRADGRMYSATRRVIVR
jgi:nitrogen fixation protein FixH